MNKANPANLLALLDELEQQARNPLERDSVERLLRFLNKEARTNLDGLCEDVFARIISLGALLFSRVDIHIRSTLKIAEESGVRPDSGLPQRLVDEGWVDRAERIARFLGEMATLRSRVGHVNRLNAKAKQDERLKLHRTLGEHPGQAGAIEGQALEGGNDREAEPIVFT